MMRLVQPGEIFCLIVCLMRSSFLRFEITFRWRISSDISEGEICPCFSRHERNWAALRGEVSVDF
jgi:hypothetical protein